ncbi:MAG: TPM domain-containing protein, partial [Vulcanimicrobiaceae bacterium]
MNRISRALAVAAALTYGLLALPALAGTWVDDGASMLTPTVASQIDAKLASFTAQTHKQIVVVTVPTTNGTPIAQAAQTMYAQRAVSGFLILVAKNDRRDIILPGRTEISSGWFSQASVAGIQTAMQSSFKAGDFDGGISGAVNSILSIYHSHLGSLHNGVATVPRYANGTSVSNVTSGGFHMPGWIWIVAILFIAYLVIRAIFRAIFGAAGRMMGGGAPMNPMGGGPMMGGPMG